MAGSRLLEFLGSAPGQSQSDRRPAELKADYVQIDERSTADLLAYARALAGGDADVGEVIRYVSAAVERTPIEGSTPGDSGDTIEESWLPFFKKPLVEGRTNSVLALFETFAHLYDYPREILNRLTGHHREFFYRDALGFEPRAAHPDRAHVVIELKRAASSVRFLPTHLLSAGKNERGIERLYSPTRETIVGQARVASLRSLSISHGNRGPLEAVPIANSADGLGGAPGDRDFSWHPFAHPGRQPADIGFALSSPILRLQSATRMIVVTLTVKQLDTARLSSTALSGAFQAYVTGAKRWLGPFAVKLTPAPERLELTIEIPESDGAVVDYDRSVHGQSYAADAPVLQLLLQPGAALAYDDLRTTIVESASMRVDVKGIRDLGLESDAGRLDPGKAFLPFGPEPTRGSRFIVHCDEALSKHPTRLVLSWTWKAPPTNFADHYCGYGVDDLRNASFTAFATVPGSAEPSGSIPLFDAANATSPATLDLLATGPRRVAQVASDYVYALERAGTLWTRRTARKATLRQPRSAPSLLHPPEAKPGSVILTLEQGFLHAEYRQKLLARTADQDPPTLLPPYVPTVQEISLEYSASTSALLLWSDEPEEFAKLDLQFFHIAPFGQRQEHAHLRAALPFVTSSSVPLLPAFDDEGELLIGMEHTRPGDSVSILFQVAPGTGDADLEPDKPRWFVLANNHWRPLGQSEVVLDSTDGLVASGTIGFVIPSEATSDNTILPGGLVWLKAAKSRQPDGSPELLDVIANAVEVQLRPGNDGFDAAHLATALPGGSITKLKTPLAQVRKVAQPYPSFGGRPEEDSDSLTVRAAERLRHRGRAISAWDYERLVLEAFPSVHRVKCIPHSRPGSWSAPGHVLLVVIADLRDRRSPDPLAPKLPAADLAAIQRHLSSAASGHVSLSVRNPSYQKVRVACDVKFLPGYEFNFYSRQVEHALVRALSPWAFDEDVPMTFGGQIYRSVLLNVVEDLACVDYVTNFQMFTFVDDSETLQDVDVATPRAPDIVLVSDAKHAISEAK